MFYIIENDQQFEDFTMVSVGEHYIYPIYADDKVHPVLSEVIAVYVHSFYLSKSFIINISHPDCTETDPKLILKWVESLDKVYTINGKLLLHWIGRDMAYNVAWKTVDLKFLDHDIDVVVDEQRKWYYDLYKSSKQVNRIIPFSLHKRYCDEISKDITKYFGSELNELHYTTLWVFFVIEQSGFNVDSKKFKELHDEVDLSLNMKDNKVYSWYNLYNTTTRPTNNFNSINFTALSKSTGIRNTIVKENDSILVEFDYKAFHLYLLAESFGMDIQENIHTYLGKQYYETDELTPEQYEESKGKTFQLIYTKSKEYDHIPFIRKCRELKQILFKAQSGTLDEKQVLPHYLQEKETSYNVEILRDMIEHLYVNKLKTKIVSYTYDSVLFNVPQDESEVIDVMYEIMSERYPVSAKYGKNYGELMPLEM